MKVLHIIDTLWLGGVQTLERDYFEYQQDNHDIFLYVLRKSEPQITVNHKNVFVANSYSRYSFAPILSLKKLIKGNKIEVLHCSLLRSHFFGFLLKALFFKNIILIIHEQGDIIDNAKLSVPILRFIKNKVNMFIACSNALRNTLIKEVNVQQDKAVTLYNTVDLKKFNKERIIWNITEERKRLNIPKDSFLVGFAGRLVKRKGWEGFIEVAKLFKNNTSVRFILAGDGEDKKKLLDIIALYKLTNVTYIGYSSDITRFYSILDCLVVPSHYEPLGMVVLEAQAMGIPVIASNVDGLNEIATNKVNALLFKPKDIIALESAIMELSGNKPLQKQLKDNGIENARKYSVENYIASLEEIYCRIV